MRIQRCRLVHRSRRLKVTAVCTPPTTSYEYCKIVLRGMSKTAIRRGRGDPCATLQAFSPIRVIGPTAVYMAVLLLLMLYFVQNKTHLIDKTCHRNINIIVLSSSSSSAAFAARSLSWRCHFRARDPYCSTFRAPPVSFRHLTGPAAAASRTHTEQARIEAPTAHSSALCSALHRIEGVFEAGQAGAGGGLGTLELYIKRVFCFILDNARKLQRRFLALADSSEEPFQRLFVTFLCLGRLGVSIHRKAVEL